MTAVAGVGVGTVSGAVVRCRLPRWIAPCVLGVVGVALAVSMVSVSLAVVVVLSGSAVVVGYCDVVWRRIPNVVCGALVGFAVVVAVVTGSGSSSVGVGVGAAMTCAPFLVVHLIQPRWVGFGDVKLLFAVGAVLALTVPLAGLGALWLSGLLVVVTLGWVPETWRTSVPYGLWLSVSAVGVAGVVAVLS